ncbi:chaperonin 10-like protein [Limtongia smithiae]|uniref:chaperonin 10-like protein n=1 Tax=Limtongia smithiae TaxID=1125753 RepID=UPI0034CE8A62
MATDYKFEGWLGYDSDSIGNMKWGEFEPKAFEDDDVDIKVSHCGICGSDLHTLRSGWGPSIYPCCVGHEIIGHVVRVGKNVTKFKIGDRVGVGAQGRSCLKPDCPACSKGFVTYCPNSVYTYNSLYPDGVGKSYGGYSTYNRTNQHFVVKIPDGIDSAHAASMMCGGVTVYSPLKVNGCGPGKKVGIVGVGGLGHFAVMWAKALGADEVVGISRRNSKKADVLAMGATKYIATLDDPDWAKNNEYTLDLIISTVSNSDMPLDDYLSLLNVHGTFIQVGAPDSGLLPSISAFTLFKNGAKIGGSSIGSPAEIEDMLAFALEKNIKPIIEVRPMKDANQAVIDMDAGKARYRYVLAN